jgi:hypothetical protein
MTLSYHCATYKCITKILFGLRTIRSSWSGSMCASIVILYINKMLAETGELGQLRGNTKFKSAVPDSLELKRSKQKLYYFFFLLAAHKHGLTTEKGSEISGVSGRPIVV